MFKVKQWGKKDNWENTNKKRAIVAAFYLKKKL